MKDSVDLLNL